jgi:hypothetical protein
VESGKSYPACKSSNRVLLMKAGKVVTIRVNPRDCMSCVDVVQKVALVTPGMSFAQIVSIALSSLLAGVREAGILPNRDGFEYGQLMQPWETDPRNVRARKLDITRELETATAGGERQIPALTVDYQKVRKERRMKELIGKREADPMNFSPEEQAEVTRLANEIL